jgi:hypothetical protein
MSRAQASADGCHATPWGHRARNSARWRAKRGHALFKARATLRQVRQACVKLLELDEALFEDGEPRVVARHERPRARLLQRRTPS